MPDLRQSIVLCKDFMKVLMCKLKLMSSDEKKELCSLLDCGVHIKDGGGLEGNGTSGNPIYVNPGDLSNKISVCTDETLSGNGTTGKCLGVSSEKLSGKVAVCIDDTLIGNGTTGNCLGVNPSKLFGTVGVNTDKQTIVGDGTLNNRLRTQISSDPGNLIQVRNNGLYYGSNPPANVGKLYVDAVSGDDSNNGLTRETPIKTFEEAIRRQIDAPTAYSIGLKCGQNFIISKKYDRRHAEFDIFGYGDPTYLDWENASTSGVPEYMPWVGEQFTRPTLTITNDTLWADFVVLRGVRVNLQSSISAPSIEMEGVVLDVQGVQSCFYSDNISIFTSRLNALPAGKYFTNALKYCTIMPTIYPGATDGHGKVPAYTPLATDIQAMMSNLNTKNLTNDTRYNTKTGQMFAAYSAWNLTEVT